MSREPSTMAIVGMIIVWLFLMSLVVFGVLAPGAIWLWQAVLP